MTEIQFNEVDSILSEFRELPDPRCEIHRTHLFGDLLVICIMSVIAGCDGPQAMGTWAATNQHWLKKHLALPNGSPSHDTLGRLLGMLKPIAFQKCFANWIAVVAPVDDKVDLNQIAIDGKVHYALARKGNFRVYAASIPMGAKKYARYVRGHWSIENTLHWGLDVAFREDESRVRDRTTANNLAWLKRFGLSLLLKQQDDRHSVAMRRRIAGWSLDYLAKALGIPVP